MYQKFYSLTRNDRIADGLNTEISPRMTLVRRPGFSVYNSQSFSNLQEFYAFKPFQASIGEQVYVIADTTTNVYNATGPSTKTSLFTKLTTAKSRFKGVENTLFWGDGTSIEKWSWFPAWAAATAYSAGTCVLDNNNAIQQVLGYGGYIASTSVTSDVATINVGSGNSLPSVGDLVAFSGLTAQTGLNSAIVPVLSVGGSSFTISYNTSNYSLTTDTGVYYVAARSGTSGSSTPSFSVTLNTVITDGSVAWISRGSSVQNMGIAAPTSAPTVSAVTLSAEPSWSATTYYWPTPLILDSNGNIQLLTTPGTTNSSVPSWNTSGTTTDGTAVWTYQGSGTRSTNTAYANGQFICVTWTFTYYSYEVVGKPPHLVKVPHTGSYSCFFECTTAGTSSSIATNSVGWNASLGSSVNDGTVVWTNVGYEITRTSSTTASPTNSYSGNTNGNVSNSVAVTTTTEIQDSNNNGQVPTVAGISGSTQPTWPTTNGAYTSETGGLTWKCQGVLGAANTGNWFYAFSYVNLATGDESTASSLSNPLLLPANSGVVISGAGSADTQVTAINIYRSVQTTTTANAPAGGPYFLTQIAAPANGASWSYTDSSPDPGNSGSLLNVLLTAAGYAASNGIITNFNDPPPTGLTNLEFHAGRLWGTVGNIGYYSTGPDVTVGNGNTSWDAENFFEVPGTIYRQWATTNGMYWFTNDGLWIITGLGTSSNPFQEPQLVDPNISISSYDWFSTNGSQANIFTNDGSFLLIDPQNGTSNLGFPIQSQISTLFPSTSSLYVTWYGNGLDQKGFISSAGTFINYMTVPPPETSYLWNSPAVLANSTSSVAMQSVETSPGLFNLLVGPSSSGPILKRDTTVFTDNGTSYDAYATFGNIVLAHHGQMAGVAFIGLDAIRIGELPNAPVLSVLLDEIVGQETTPYFTAIPNPVNDPPNLPASNTLYNLRYWLVNTQQPCFCRHMLIKFDFSTDTVQNELLAYTIYGTSIVEE